MVLDVDSTIVLAHSDKQGAAATYKHTYGFHPILVTCDHGNGSSPKMVRIEVGDVRLEVPRDRQGSFTPQIVPMHARRVEGFDEASISLYAKGLTTGEIQAHLAEIYDVQVSRDLVSRVTDKVAEELAAWQSRPLDAVYPVLLIDAIHVKIRDGAVANRPVNDDGLTDPSHRLRTPRPGPPPARRESERRTGVRQPSLPPRGLRQHGRPERSRTFTADRCCALPGMHARATNACHRLVRGGRIVSPGRRIAGVTGGPLR